MQLDLQGKVALVTGAARGIGKDIASTLASEGCKTVLADVLELAAADLAAELASEGRTVLPVYCDVANSDSARASIDRAIAEFGRLDILVNNAGVFRPGSVEEQTEEDWDRTMDVNLKGVFLMCKHAIPAMKRQRSGRIINAASFAAIVPSIRGASYAASKAAVVSFTRVLAGELGPYGITANSYAPGMIPTDINDFATSSPQRQRALLDTLTIREWGKAKDVADLICFLASDKASYITGSLIDVSGGKLATQLPRGAYEMASGEGAYQFPEADGIH
jgi:3-oxoacyl-[acyl-carrier protein] reductase